MSNQNLSKPLNKGISTLIGIVIVVLVVIVAGGILIYQQLVECNFPVDCEDRFHIMCVGEWECVEHKCVWSCGTGKTIKDETVDWKTYRNKEYGYEIKYPSSLEIFEKEQDRYVEIGLVLVNFSIKIKENMSLLEELKSLEEEILENTGISASDLKISWKDKTFLGLPAKELSFKGFTGGEPMIRRIYIIKNNNAYILSSGNAENFDEYYQMLSTFRFLE